MKDAFRGFCVFWLIALVLCSCMSRENTVKLEVRDQSIAEEQVLMFVETKGNRIYSIEDFANLEIGRTTVLEAIEMGLGKPSYTTNGGDVYRTQDPDIVIHMNFRTEYPVVSFFSISNQSALLDSENSHSLNETNLEHIGAKKVEGSLDDLTWNTLYVLQDFLWLQVGKTTVEDLCSQTPTTDYFQEYRDEIRFWYPTENPATWICVTTNAQGVIYALSVSWDQNKDPYLDELAYMLTSEYKQRYTDAIMEYLQNTETPPRTD